MPVGSVTAPGMAGTSLDSGDEEPAGPLWRIGRSAWYQDGVEDADHHSNPDTEEGEALNSLTPAAGLLGDDWKGAEEHAQCAVGDGNVNGDKEDY